MRAANESYALKMNIIVILAVISVFKKKTPTHSEVSYVTLIWPFLIYNASTTWLKLSEMKRSGITNLAAKIRVPELVGMETVIHSLFFQWPLSQQGVKLLSWNFGNVSS